eukprot:CAMPEP_0201286090 /NCGR_PEP_ID=MMETSP1317-20130820/114246_1 /ASSEMBLY_ACC=CAM_ASM_000770 /TAXON_ID=187299 /ORGANISM="Undescribed Undescribed, Strain Undescribed" /LENGTH=137 /DNA_ID=CAMNT_0047612585 /DNA_START=530 /DNA_END=943 /DNA_ORIENTATION=-
MKGLVLKILRGNYPSIPSAYSDGLRQLINEMLQKDPQKRPSCRKILEKEFLRERINKLFGQTIARYEKSKRLQIPELEWRNGRCSTTEARKDDFETEESGGDQSDQKFFTKFLTPSGSPLPGIQPTDSLAYRLEILR